VTWYSEINSGSDSSYSHTAAQQFGSNGLRIGNEFQVNTYTPGGQVPTSLAADANGTFTVVFYSSLGGVRARRYGSGNPIRGSRLLFKDPRGDEGKRKVIIISKDLLDDVVLGDPTASGSTLRLITSGGTSVDQTFALDAEGWKAIGSRGFRYAGPTGSDGDPVQRVLIKRSASGKAILKAILKGSIGTQSLDIVPPNPASSASLALTFPGGGAYCTSFDGGEEGSTTVQDDAKKWKILNPSGTSCPQP